MDYYGYFSSDKDLPNDYTDKLTLYMIGKYKQYFSIFENRTNHTLRIVKGAESEQIELSPSASSNIRRFTKKEFEEDEMHLWLLEKLTDKIPADSTIVFKHIEALGRTAEYALKAYKKIAESGVQMRFVNISPLNSEAFLTTGKKLDNNLIPLLTKQIELALKEEEEKKEIKETLSSLPRKEKKELHLNSLDLNPENW